MRIESVHIGNFKTIQECECTLVPYTVLIGANNCGKCNMLRALQLFFEDGSRNIDEECYRNKDMNMPIEITLTFTDCTQTKKTNQILDGWIVDERMKIKKTISFNAESGKHEQILHGWRP